MNITDGVNVKKNRQLVKTGWPAAVPASAAIFFLLFQFIAGVPPVCAAANGNLMENPGFEKADKDGKPAVWSVPTRWQDWIGAIESSDHAFKGNKALMVKLSGDDKGRRIEQRARIPVDKPGKYEFDFYVKVIGKAQVSARWFFLGRDGEIKPAGQSQKMQRPLRSIQTLNWTRVSETLDVPEGTEKVGIIIACNLETDTAEAVVFFDEVSLVRASDKALQAGAMPEGAKLVVDETFSSGNIPDGWEVADGEWKVENGALAGSRYGKIFYTNKIGSPNMRVEYTAWTDGQPGDLSAAVAVREPGVWRGLECYYFGFGSSLNSKNRILRRKGSDTSLAERGGELEVFEDGIRPGVKHKVVAQRNYNEVKFFVDGKLVLEGNDPFFSAMDGEIFGFILDNPGCISNVKVYALPFAAGTVAGEKNVEFRIHEGFETCADAWFTVESGKPALQTVNRPTWIYKTPMGNEYVTDNCLEIVAQTNEVKLSRTFDPLESGIIEFDVLAEAHDEIKFAVSDEAGKTILNLVISKDGRLMTEDRNGRRVLREKIRYQRRMFDADFKFARDRWHTFRLQFSRALRQIVLLHHYTEIIGTFPLGNQGDYMPIEYDFSALDAGNAASFSISITQPARLYVDNLIVFGPIGADTVNGKPLTLPAHELLGIEFPPRKDPFTLKTQSYRHLTRSNQRETPLFKLREKAPKYKFFREAGNVYNEALVNLAFIGEKLNMLDRAAIYIKDAGAREKIGAELPALEIMCETAEDLQEQALNAYARAYLSEQDEKQLGEFYNIAENIKNNHENINAAMASILALLKPRAASNEIIQCPAPFKDGEITWSVSNRRWEQNGEPVVFNYFSHLLVYPSVRDELRTLGFRNHMDTGASYKLFPQRDNEPSPKEEGVYADLDNKNFQFIKSLARENRKGLMRMASGSGTPAMAAPQWWYEKYKNEDIIFTDPAGNAPKSPLAGARYLLNWWHPEVKMLIREQFGAIGKFAAEHKNAVTLMQTGQELKNHLYHGLFPGYNPTAIAEFRKVLETKYHTVADLNRAWNADYHSFDDVVPPPPRATAPSGLQYEFNKFVADGFSGWLRSVTDALQTYTKDIPVAADGQNTLGHGLTDLIGFVRAVDIKLYHTYQAWDRKFVDRWHHQVAEKALNTPWGTMEWVVSEGCPCMFETDKMRNNGLREKTMLMIWGGTMPEFYGYGFGNWQYDTGITEPRLDRMVFNYTAPFYAIYMERQRRLGKVALTAPTAKPAVALLETTTAWLNGLPVREGMRPIAIELAETGWDFEFLYEQLLVEKRQSLAGTEVLFVPAGLCMPTALADIVYEWVHDGGVLFCAGGPAGIWNEYGQPAGRLDKVFGADWTNADGAWELAGIAPFYASDGVRAWQTDYGKGKTIVFDNMDNRMFELMAGHTEKRFGCDNPNIQFCMRESNGVKYLYALNWSVDTTEETVIFVQGAYDSIVDEGLQLPMAVPHGKKDGKTFFRTKLAPAEVTLFRMQ